MNFIPLDVIFCDSIITAVAEWRKPKWADAGCPFPGIRVVVDAWRDSQIIRDLKADADDLE